MPTNFFTIRIDGLPERITGIDNIVNGFDSVKHQILEEISTFMAEEMRRNVHVITGNLKSSITSQVLGDTAIVSAGAEYAVYENRRIGPTKTNTGPHDFADRAEAATEQRAPQIVSAALDRLFSQY